MVDLPVKCIADPIFEYGNDFARIRANFNKVSASLVILDEDFYALFNDTSLVNYF